jgi:hypothetical protein
MTMLRYDDDEEKKRKLRRVLWFVVRAVVVCCCVPQIGKIGKSFPRTLMGVPARKICEAYAAACAAKSCHQSSISPVSYDSRRTTT